jgi:hypothetical protein
LYNQSARPNVVQASNSTEVAPLELGQDPDPAPAPTSLLTTRQPQAYVTPEQVSPGIAASVDLRNNHAKINFPQGETVRVGTVLRGYHTYAFTGKQPVGEFVVIQSMPGFAVVRPHGQTKLNKLVSGDQLLPAE